MAATPRYLQYFIDIPRKSASVARKFFMISVPSDMQRNLFCDYERRPPPFVAGWRLPSCFRRPLTVDSREASFNDGRMELFALAPAHRRRNSTEDYIAHDRLPYNATPIAPDTMPNNWGETARQQAERCASIWGMNERRIGRFQAHQRANPTEESA
jgi:hypothetical protein